jgi:antitoxin CcdA
MKKRFEDPAKPFRPAEPAKHSGHIGPAPKTGPKRAVNISVDAEILQVAKEMNLSISAVCESALRKATEAERIRRWQAENRASLDSYDALIERAGVFGEEWREW